MQIQYVGCNPLDKLGAIPHAVFRLTFVPQNYVLPDSWFANDWNSKMAEQLDRIGATPYLYAAQGTATVVDDKTHGRAGVIDCLFRNDQANAPIQVAAQAVEDSYGYAKLSRLERIGAISAKAAEDRPAEQTAVATTVATAESADTPGAIVKRYAGWALLAVVVGVVGLIVWKAPKLGS